MVVQATPCFIRVLRLRTATSTFRCSWTNFETCDGGECSFRWCQACICEDPFLLSLQSPMLSPYRWAERIRRLFKHGCKLAACASSNMPAYTCTLRAKLRNQRNPQFTFVVGPLLRFLRSEVPCACQGFRRRSPADFSLRLTWLPFKKTKEHVHELRQQFHIHYGPRPKTPKPQTPKPTPRS